MRTKIIEIAGIIIKINISNEISNLVANDLDAVEKSEFNKFDIEININQSKDFDYKVISGNNLKFTHAAYINKFLPNLDYVIENLFLNKPTILNIDLKSSKSIKNKLKTILYGKNIIEKNIILSYSLFWYIFQIKLMQFNKTFLHAGIFSDNEENAIAITGTGGGGKTSTLFNILEDSKYNYLSEDFGIIDTDGYTYYNPKPISIYETDMRFNPKVLGKAYSLLTQKEKLLWSFQVKYLKRDPIVKMNPKTLLNDRIAQKAKLKKVVYVIRENRKEFEYQSISKEELSQRSLNVALREFKTIYEILTLLNANKPKEYDNIPTFDTFKNDLMQLYLKTFSKTQNFILKIPYKRTPEDVVIYLKKHGLFDE